jgi:hypothetical protein
MSTPAKGICSVVLFSLALPSSHAQFATNISMVPQPRLTIVSPVGISNRVEYTAALGSGWTTLTNILVAASPYQISDHGALPATERFYRVVDPVVPSNMATVSTGCFLLGDFLDGYGVVVMAMPQRKRSTSRPSTSIACP